MPTLYTHYMVTWIADDLRAAAIAALNAAAQADVTGYPAQLEPVGDGDAVAWADWSAARPESLPAYLAVARQVCGEGTYTVVDGVHTYLGDGGGWCAWPRKATPPADTRRALDWLVAQGWQRASEGVI